MNKKYILPVKLVFLIFLILIIIGIIFSGNKKAGAESGAGAGDLKPVKVIDTDTIIQGNQFWSVDFDYKILSTVTIPTGSSLSIENGANINVIDNGSFSVNGGVLNVGSTASSQVPYTPTDFLSGLNSISNLIIVSTSSLALADNIFTSSVYKSSNILSTIITITGAGYNSLFEINNGGIVNARKLNIQGQTGLGMGAGVDLQRTVIGLYKSSKINLFETNINNINVGNHSAFYANDNSRIVLYRSNVNGFSGDNLIGLFKNSVLSVLRSKINDAKADAVVNLFTGSVLNFQKSSISANPLKLTDYNSGTCISGFNTTTITVTDSDIGPCFIAFSLYGTGKFKINQNNISGNGNVILNFSPSADFRNNWWGRDSGPKVVDLSALDPDGNYSSEDYRIAIKNQNAVEDHIGGVIAQPFSAVQFKEASPCCSSVLFIPGFQGSRLYKKGAFSGGGIIGGVGGGSGGVENQLWEPNRNKDVESLFLNSSGQSLDSGIYTKDIIAKTNFFGPLGSIDIYQSTIDLLSKEKADKNIDDFQTLAYDWRFLPSNILSSGIKNDSYTVMLKDKIKDMAKKASSGKVIIVAHSYGGLLAKSLAEDLEKEGTSDLVESIVLVSVPEYGTPQAVSSLFYGDNEDLLGGLILSKKTAISLGKNMLSAHLLLPSSSYFAQSDSIYNQKNLISFDNWTSSRFDLSGMFGNMVNSFPLMKDFLRNKNIVSSTGINSAVFDMATAEHDKIDNYSSNLSAKTYSIVAVGIPTLSGMSYVKPKCRGFLFCSPNTTSLPDFTRKYSLMGDGVVIAHNLGARTGSVFTVDIGKENDVKKMVPAYFREDPIAHKDVFRSSGVKDILHAILSRVKREPEMINSFSLLSNPYVAYVSGSLSKPGPILGSYGDSSILAGIPKIKDDATDSDFVARFNNSKILTVDAYGSVTLKPNYKTIDDLQNKQFEQLDLQNRIVNSTSYSDGNRVGIVSVVPSSSTTPIGSAIGSAGLNIFGQGSGVGTAQIVTKIDNTEIIYPNISVTPSTNIDIDYSTTTIAIDNNSDGVADKNILPIQINVGTSTGTSTYQNALAGGDVIAELFAKARARILSASATSTSVSTSTGTTATTSAPFSSSSIYLANKYVEKLGVAERKYQKAGVWQSLILLKSFYGSMESNMGTISNLIINYNKEQSFYSLNNFFSTNKKVMSLSQRQKEIREEILLYIEIHDVFSELMQKMGEGL